MNQDRRTFLTRTGMGLLAAMAALRLDHNLLDSPIAYAHPNEPTSRSAQTRPANEPIAVVIDSDPGVDDASALVWLLSQQMYQFDLLGICTVAGNTSLENATQNVLTVLDVVAPGRPIPVVMGAEKPLSGKLSHIPKLIHGPDGLWFSQRRYPIQQLPNNTPLFYRSMAESRPGFTVVALGPLTNLAEAVRRFPDTADGIGRIVWLGGAKCGGNHTPVSEFNAWQDPEAAEIVLGSGIPVTMVPLDTFTGFVVTPEDVQRLESGNAGGRFLVQPLRGLLGAFERLTGQALANLPDVIAMMLAFDSSLAQTTQDALVKIVADRSLTHGQTIVALTFIEHLTLIASDAELSALVDRAFSDPSFDLFAAFLAIVAREPANVQWVSKVDAAAVRDRFLQALTAS